MNKTDKKVTYNLFVGTKKTMVNIPAQAMQSLIY